MSEIVPYITLFPHTFTKAEHKSGLPMAHYRYTHGKTHGYGNSQVWVTGNHRSMWIWVHVLGDASTHCKYLWDYGYLFIILLHFGYLQFLFIEIFIAVIIFQNCNKIHNIHVNTTTKWMLLQHCCCCSHYQFPLLLLPPHPCPCPRCGGSDVATQHLHSCLSCCSLGSPHLCTSPCSCLSRHSFGQPLFMLTSPCLHLFCHLFGQPPFVLTNLCSRLYAIHLGSPHLF